MDEQYILEHGIQAWVDDVVYPLHEVTISETYPYVLKVGVDLVNDYVISRVYDGTEHASHARLVGKHWTSVFMHELNAEEKAALRGWHPPKNNEGA